MRLAEKSWRELDRATNAGYFQTYAVARAWLETIGAAAECEPLIVVGMNGDIPAGLFPAARVKLHGIPVVTWMGIPDILDAGDVLYDRARADSPVEEFVSVALAKLRTTFGRLPFLFPNVRADATVLPAFNELLVGLERGAIAVTDTGDDLETYLHRLGTHRRKGLRRLERRLENVGRVALQTNRVSGDACGSALEPAFRMKQAQRAAQDSGQGLLSDDYLRCHVLQHALGIEGLVNTLLVDDAPIAYSYDILHGDVAYGLLGTFAVEHARYSPGTILARRLIEELHHQGYSRWDWGWGLEPYKLTWNPAIIGLKTFVDRGPLGRALLGAVATKDWLTGVCDPAERLRRRSAADVI